MRNYLYNIISGKYKGIMPGLIWFFLFLLSLVYSLVIRFLIFYKRLNPKHLKTKVISVGNITVGGTGKTVLVEFISRYLNQQGRKIAIISRGYKKTGKSKIRQFKDDNPEWKLSYEAMGDEPYMLAKRLGDIPVIVGANRVKASNKAAENYAVGVVILDDGFQQWGIYKDLEIVTIDATNPFGNRHLLPGGILREPLSSLKRADIFVLTKADRGFNIQATKEFLELINPAALVVDSVHAPVGFYNLDRPDELLDTDFLKSKSIALLSGIGNPDSFENSLKNLGINAALSFRFPDHHHYLQKDLDNLANMCRFKLINTIITTEKDAARIKGMGLVIEKIEVFVLRIELKVIENEKEFYSRLLSLRPA